MELFHFTSEFHLPYILEDGFLKVVESNISPNKRNAGPQVVWTTTNIIRDAQGWEQGSIVDKTAVRFTLQVPDEDVFWWPTWSRSLSIPDWWYDALDVAGGGGSELWYVVPRPIPRSEWLSVRIDGRDVSLKIEA